MSDIGVNSNGGVGARGLNSDMRGLGARLRARLTLLGLDSVGGSSGSSGAGVTSDAASELTLVVGNAPRGELLAALEWRDVLSDRVTLGQGKQIKLSEWLKKSVVPFVK